MLLSSASAGIILLLPASARSESAASHSLSLAHSITCLLAHHSRSLAYLKHSLMRLCTPPRTVLFTRLAHSPRSLAHMIIHSLTHLLTHSLNNHSYAFSDRLTLQTDFALTNLLTNSFTYITYVPYSLTHFLE